MKIIHTDNFGGDYPDEKFVTGIPPMHCDRMQRVADAINAECGGEMSPRYYRVVEDDYVLQPGFEP